MKPRDGLDHPRHPVRSTAGPPIHDAPPDAKSREPSLHVLKKRPVTTGLKIAVFIRNTWGATSNFSSYKEELG